MADVEHAAAATSSDAPPDADVLDRSAGQPADGGDADPVGMPPPRTAAAGQRLFGVWRLALFSFIFIASVNSTPALASYGMASIFFYGLAIIFLLVPTAMASSELGASVPETGGVYVWVRTAYGERLGFLIIWLELAAQTIALPVIMTTIATQVAYGFDPALANDDTFMFMVVVATIWAMTLMATRGLKVAKNMNLVAVVIGNLIPAVIIIGLAILWLVQGRGSQMEISASAIVPEWSGFSTIVFASTTFLMFAGIEISSIHAGNVENPRHTIPRANAITAVLCVLLFVPVTLAIAVVVAPSTLDVVAGLMQAVRDFFPVFDLEWFVPIFALMIATGLALAVMQMFGGPARGVMIAARQGNLPRFFHHENHHGSPQRIIVTQACISSVLAISFVLMPSVENAWWALGATQTMLTLLVYVIMYASLLRLRRQRPDLPRPYKIPGGRAGLYVVTIGGSIACLAVVAINTVPPSQLDNVSFPLYAGALSAGVITVCGLPFLIRHWRKPSWVAHDAIDSEATEVPEASASSDAEVDGDVTTVLD